MEFTDKEIRDLVKSYYTANGELRSARELAAKRLMTYDTTGLSFYFIHPKTGQKISSPIVDSAGNYQPLTRKHNIPAVKYNLRDYTVDLVSCASGKCSPRSTYKKPKKGRIATEDIEFEDNYKQPKNMDVMMEHASEAIDAAKMELARIPVMTKEEYYLECHDRPEMPTPLQYLKTLKPFDEKHHGVCIQPSPQEEYLYETKCWSIIRIMIDCCREEIKISAYQLSHPMITYALVQAIYRGVKISIIIDRMKLQSRISKETLILLYLAGVDYIGIDCTNQIHHNKFMIFDQTVVLTGSYNFSEASANHAENFLVDATPKVVEAYETAFANLLTYTVPYSVSGHYVTSACIKSD